MADERYTVKELADRTGVTPRTVYYYVSEGLLPPPEGGGPASTYGVEHLARLELIRRLKDEFLPLAEIRRRLEGLTTAEILALLDAPPEPPPPDDARAYLRRLLGPRTPDPRRADSQRGDRRHMDRAGRLRRAETPPFGAPSPVPPPAPAPSPIPPTTSSPLASSAPVMPDAGVAEPIVPDVTSPRDTAQSDANFGDLASDEGRDDREVAPPSAFATPSLAAPQPLLPAPQEPPASACPPGQPVAAAPPEAAPGPLTLADEMMLSPARSAGLRERAGRPSLPLAGAQTWERLRISDDVELHVRQGASPGVRRRIARMVDALRRILRD